jgi:hypothetical protein
MRTRAGLAALALALACAPGIASANGRAPATNGIYFGPADTHSLYVRSTFGLLISHDDGGTFNWVCEDNIGYGGTFDPKYAIATDGTIFAATYDGLEVSRDGGCSFELSRFRGPVRPLPPVSSGSQDAGPPPYHGQGHDLWVDALDIGPTGEVWGATAESGAPNNVFTSNDNGHTFLAGTLGSTEIWWKSVKVAPTDATRVYVTGYQVAHAVAGSDVGPSAHLVRSDDDGATWQSSPLAGVAYGPTPIVIVQAVSPADKDVLFLVSIAAGPSLGDRVYRSADGGATLTEVLATTGTVTDVVVRDASHVIIATTTDGAYESSDGGQTYLAHKPHAPEGMAGATDTPTLACLGQRSDGMLFGCGGNWVPDYKAVASSMDDVSWSKVFRFVDIAGPLACPVGTAERDVCCGEWGGDNGLRVQFGAPATGSAACSGSGASAVETSPDATLKAHVQTAGGCCDAGAGAPASVLFGLGLGALLLRRRRV